MLLVYHQGNKIYYKPQNLIRLGRINNKEKEDLFQFNNTTCYYRYDNSKHWQYSIAGPVNNA